MNNISITLPDGTIKVLYEPTPKQLEAHMREEPNVLFWGGRGSGKSTWGRWHAHMCALAYPGFKYCVLRRTFPELEKSHLIDLPKEMALLGGYYHATSHIAYYPNGSTGFFSHCATEEHVLNLLSAEFYLMFFDEVSTFPWDVFTKLAASCRVPKSSGLKAQVRAATNPLGASAEQINRYFVLKDITFEEDEAYNPNDWYDIKANIEDNEHIDKTEYLKRFAGLPAHFRKAWVEGEFGIENALFDFHPTLNGKPYHVIDSIDLDALVKNAQIYRVFDMGYFPDPAYCAWIAHLGHRYIVFHEKLWFKTIASDIAHDIKAEDERLGVTKVVITYCDPTIDIRTGADIRTIKDIFEDNGISMETSINKRDLFASHIHTALSEEAEPANPDTGSPAIPRLQVYVGPRRVGAPYLAKTLPQQRYNPKKPMFLDDHPDDHATVAVAYFLISSGAMERRTMKSVGMKPWMKPKNSDRYVLGREGVHEQY